MTPIIKRLKSKTYWVALTGAAVLVVEQNSGYFSEFLPESLRTVAVLLWPVLMVTLREITHTSISEK